MNIDIDAALDCLEAERAKAFKQIEPLMGYVNDRSNQLDLEANIGLPAARLIVFRSLVEAMGELAHLEAGEAVAEDVSKRAISTLLGYSGSATIQRKFPLSDVIGAGRKEANKTGRRVAVTLLSGLELYITPRNNTTWNIAAQSLAVTGRGGTLEAASWNFDRSALTIEVSQASSEQLSQLRADFSELQMSFTINVKPLQQDVRPTGLVTR